MKTLIYYHDRCHDGLTAAWVLLRALPDAEARGVQFGHPPPVEDAAGFGRVIFADVCFEEAYLCAVLKYQHGMGDFIPFDGPDMREIVVLDHHETSKKMLPGQRWNIDTTRSGAMLALEWLQNNTDEVLAFPFRYTPSGKARYFVCAYAQDRDLWKFDLPSSREVYEYVSATVPLDLEGALPALDDLATLLKNDFENVVRTGSLLLKMKERRLIENWRRVVVRDGIVFVNAEPNIRSDLGNFLGPDDLVMVWSVDEHGKVRCSARGPGARAWCEARGGGGHDLAAGCEVTLQQMMEMLR